MTTRVFWPPWTPPTLNVDPDYCGQFAFSTVGASHMETTNLDRSTVIFGLGYTEVATLLDIRWYMKGLEALTVVSDRLLPYLPITQQDIASEAASGIKTLSATPHIQSWPSIVAMVLANKLASRWDIMKLIDKVDEARLCGYIKLLLRSKRATRACGSG